MAIKIRKQAASTVVVPASTHLQFFVDTDGTPKLKDEFDNVYTVSQSGGGGGAFWDQPSGKAVVLFYPVPGELA